MTLAPAIRPGVAPFDTEILDRLMGEAGLDCLVATSRHNVQYLLGGYRFFFFETMDALGTSRYLPAVVYPRGRPAETVYVGCVMEAFERDNGRLWPETLDLGRTGAAATAEQVAGHIARLGLSSARIGAEAPFIPADAAEVLRKGLGGSALCDAVFVLERLRARKTPAEIAALTTASESVVEAMLATFAATRPGQTKADVAERLRLEEVKRGLVFDYCLITAGASLNRAPSPQQIAKGDIVSLDSGGNRHGYIGDLCRMASLGRPDGELQDLLGFVDEVQQAARATVRPKARGGDVVASGARMVAASPHRAYTQYQAHGMGLVSHEAPRLMDLQRNSYAGYDKDRPLEPGMVLSIETTMAHPKRGFIKLEDTVLVTDTGHRALGDGGRSWTEIAV